MELEIANIQAGDILLCYSPMTADEKTADGTGYSHAAIALARERVLEASNKGVRIVDVGQILDDYDHIAVLREANPAELWDGARLNSLEGFATQVEGRHFNQMGLMRFLDRKEKHQRTLMERIPDHVAGTTPEIESIRTVYFCSELITSAFIHVGIIAQSAAVVFDPRTFSPSDIGKDKIFGYFRGYVKRSPSYVVPDGDFFQSNI